MPPEQVDCLGSQQEPHSHVLDPIQLTEGTTILFARLIFLPMITEVTTPAPTDTGGSMPGLSSKICFTTLIILRIPSEVGRFEASSNHEEGKKEEDGGHEAVLYVDAARLTHPTRQFTRDIGRC